MAGFEPGSSGVGATALTTVPQARPNLKHHHHLKNYKSCLQWRFSAAF